MLQYVSHFTVLYERLTRDSKPGPQHCPTRDVPGVNRRVCDKNSGGALTQMLRFSASICSSVIRCPTPQMGREYKRKHSKRWTKMCSSKQTAEVHCQDCPQSRKQKLPRCAPPRLTHGAVDNGQRRANIGNW